MGSVNVARSCKMGSGNKPNLPNGMPDMGSSAAGKPLLLLVFTIVPALIGFGIAMAIFTWGSTAAYTAKIATCGDMVWVFASLIVFNRAVAFINSYPAMISKAKIMRQDSKNLRANPFIYQTIGTGAVKNTTIVLQDEGDVGEYNRANRSVHHMVENSLPFAGSIFLVGSYFPFPVFVLTCVWAVGRTAHQIGYTTGYGGHGAGFMLSMI